jgi:predicted lipid-binding transport protein (Tim44 family)
MKSGIAALILMSAAPLAIASTHSWIAGSLGSNSLVTISWVTPSWITPSWITPSWAQDVPPSAAPPQSQSDQPEVTPTSPQTEVPEAQFTTQQTGSASGAEQFVPLAQKVDPVASAQSVGSEASK